jgi:phage gp36-like protein
VTRYSIDAPEGLTLWLESVGSGSVWLGLTDDSETVQTYSAVPVAEIRYLADALSAVVARLEREEEQ